MGQGERLSPRMRSARLMPASCSVFLNVTDIQRSLDFYRGLGFRVVKAWKDDEGEVAWADLNLLGADLGLGHIPSNDDASFREWVSTPLGAGVIVYFSVSNAQRHWERAQQAGATVEMPLTQRPYGKMFTLNDPDGYTVSFIEEPKPARKKPQPRSGAKTRQKKAGAKKAAKSPKRAAKKARGRKRAR